MFIGDRLRTTQLVRIISEPRPINSTAVRVTWQLRRIQAHYVDGYRVRYRVLPDYDQSFQDMEDDVSFMEDTVLGGSVMSHVIGGLDKYTLYEVFVQPFFRNVVGQQSNVVRVRTGEDGNSFTCVLRGTDFGLWIAAVFCIYVDLIVINNDILQANVTMFEMMFVYY